MFLCIITYFVIIYITLSKLAQVLIIVTCIQKVPGKNLGQCYDCTLRCFVIFYSLFREVVEASQLVDYMAFYSSQKMEEIYSFEKDVNVCRIYRPHPVWRRVISTIVTATRKRRRRGNTVSDEAVMYGYWSSAT
jgi:hypothetical protein